VRDEAERSARVGVWGGRGHGARGGAGRGAGQGGALEGGGGGAPAVADGPEDRVHAPAPDDEAQHGPHLRGAVVARRGAGEGAGGGGELAEEGGEDEQAQDPVGPLGQLDAGRERAGEAEGVHAQVEPDGGDEEGQGDGARGAAGGGAAGGGGEGGEEEEGEGGGDGPVDVADPEDGGVDGAKEQVAGRRDDALGHLYGVCLVEAALAQGHEEVAGGSAGGAGGKGVTGDEGLTTALCGLADAEEVHSNSQEGEVSEAKPENMCCVPDRLRK
jgi:hypothetical protein